MRRILIIVIALIIIIGGILLFMGRTEAPTQPGASAGLLEIN